MEGLRLILIIIGIITIAIILIHGVWLNKQESVANKILKNKTEQPDNIAKSNLTFFNLEKIFSKLPQLNKKTKPNQFADSDTTKVGPNIFLEQNNHEDQQQNYYQNQLDQKQTKMSSKTTIKPKTKIAQATVSTIKNTRDLTKKFQNHTNQKDQQKDATNKNIPNIKISFSTEDIYKTVKNESLTQPINKSSTQKSSFDYQKNHTDFDKLNTKARNMQQQQSNKNQSSLKQKIIITKSPDDFHSNIKEVITLHLVAKSGVFHGEKLLQTLITQGFKFGSLGIFHKYKTGNNNVLFSAANMVKPGSFDLDSMSVFSTKGIAIFMTLPCKENAKDVFADMLNTTNKIATQLQAQIQDERRNSLTKQKLGHLFQKIKEYERQKLLVPS